MEKIFSLGIVDQSVVRQGGSATEALTESVKLAGSAENFGYTRYWVAEHHNSTSFTGNAPEILIGQIAANTTNIKVGSGGVMLQHYSALKVAEQFRMLESFNPGRIELGIGRAPGSDQLTAKALAYPKSPMDMQFFPQMVIDLLGFLEEDFDDDHPFRQIKTQAGNKAQSSPKVWILGSSDFSAQMAGHLGLPFSFADFFGTTGKYGHLVTELYRKNFKPSRFLSEPRINVAIQALCAPTEEEAKFIAASRNLNKANRYLELKEGLLSPEKALCQKIPPIAQEYIDSLAPYYVDGNPQQVSERLTCLAEKYGANDISIVTTCYDYTSRERSYELISDAFGFNSAKQL